MDIKILKDFLRKSYETKMSLIFDNEFSYKELFFTESSINEFILDSKEFFNQLNKEEQLTYVFILFKFTSDDFDKNRVLGSLSNITDILSDFKIYDDNIAGFSSNRKRFLFELKYLLSFLNTLNEDEKAKVINNLIEKYSPNVILFLSNNNNYIKNIKRKKVSLNSFIDSVKTPQKLAELFNIYSKDKENLMLKMLIEFFELNKTKIIKKDVLSYFKFKSLISILEINHYTKEQTFKDFIDYYNKNEQNLSESQYVEILKYAFQYKAFEDEYRKNKVYMSYKELDVSSYEDRPEMESDLFELMSKYEWSQSLKALGFKGLKKDLLKKSKYKESYGSKRDFIINILGLDLDEEMLDANSIERALNSFKGNYLRIPEVYFITEIMPFYEHIWLMNKIKSYVNEIENMEKQVRKTSNGYETVNVLKSISFKLTTESNKILSIFISLCDENLKLSNDARDLIDMQFKI